MRHQVSEILPTLTGCTDHFLTRTYLHNAHESMVWLIDHPTRSWTTDHLDPTIQIFRDGVALAGQLGLTLEPGQEVTLEVPPSAVHLTLDPGVQGAWQLRTLLVEAAKDKAVDWAKTNTALGIARQLIKLTPFSS